MARSDDVEEEEMTDTQRMPELGDSPDAQRYATEYTPSPVQSRMGKAELPYRQSGPWSDGLLEGPSYAASQADWQEGLSMVPEESYIEEASRMQYSPAASHNDASRRSVGVVASPLRSTFMANSVEKDADASTSLPVSGEGETAEAARHSPSEPAESPSKSQEASRLESVTPPSPSVSSQPEAQIASPSRQSPPTASPVRSSPAPKASAPSTPKSAPRPLSTPKSFARLRVGTPVRSSPLSRVVNFTPSSTSSSPRWQSPASQRSVDASEAASPQAKFETPAREGSVIVGLTTPASDSVDVVEQFQTPGGDALLVESEDGKENGRDRSLPQTPKDGRDVATPSRFFSPAASDSFATPAFQRPSSAPTTPAPVTAHNDALNATPADAASSSLPAFGTPQWTPSPASTSTPAAPEVSQTAEQITEQQQESINARSAPGEEESSPRSISSCSSSSERKQSGDISTASIASQVPLSNDEPRKDQLEKSAQRSDESTLPTQRRREKHFDSSPSAARFSRLQLTRLAPTAAPPQPPKLPLALVSSHEAAPELNVISTAFNTLSQLSDDRVSRLIAQLSASTAHVEALEKMLEAKEDTEARLEEELDDVRSTLGHLKGEYEGFVQQTEAREVEVGQLVAELQGRIEARKSKEGSEERVAALERELEEERRLREVERRDFEVRLQALLNPTSSSPSPQEFAGDAVVSLADKDAMEVAKAQLRASMEKDFDIRRSMEHRELLAKIAELEAKLVTSTSLASSIPSRLLPQAPTNQLLLLTRQSRTKCSSCKGKSAN